MKKSFWLVVVLVFTAILAAMTLPSVLSYFNPLSSDTSDTSGQDSSSDSSSEETEPIYHRIEAEKYEIQFPLMVNNHSTYGCLYTPFFTFDDVNVVGSFIFSDEDCIFDSSFSLSFMVYADGYSRNQPTLYYQVIQGDYGRYVISDTQIADEPIFYILEPIYEYVLVE